MISSSGSLPILSLVPGRVRVHLPGWTEENWEGIESRLRQINGVETVQANPRTGNALIYFDHRTTTEAKLLRELRQAWTSFIQSENVAAPRFSLPTPHSTFLQVGVRGLLGHAAVDSLWFGAGFLGQSIGLPLAGLGPLHVIMDIVVWMMAFQSGLRNPVTSLAVRMPSESAGEDGTACGAVGGLKEGAKRSRSPQR
jgi:hypothetical protein